MKLINTIVCAILTFSSISMASEIDSLNVIDTKDIVNVVELAELINSNIELKTVTVTKVLNEPLRDEIPSASLKKVVRYSGVATNTVSEEVGSVAIKLSKPSKYRLINVSVSVRMPHGVRTAKLAGTIDDYNSLVAYDQYGSRLEFNGTTVSGKVITKMYNYYINADFNTEN